MLDFDTAQARLAARGRAPAAHETVALDALCGRVLAKDIVAVLDLPPADNSAMDGYALRAADAVVPGTTLPVQQRCFAGQAPEPLLPGQAIRLFTGSVIPAGADTVVMQEDCREDDGRVTILAPSVPGRHIRRQGEDMQRGQAVLARGTRLGAGQLAVLAAQGYDRAPVFPRLKVGILTTGDELIPPGQPLPPAAIHNSNAPMLASLCSGLGTAVPMLRHARDDADATRRALAELNEACDLVLSVGGASVGEKDLVKPALESLGGTLDLWKVRMKPGKPVALAELNGRPVVCLPGNPVSAFAVFMLLVSPLIRGLQGRRDVLPPVRRGILDTLRPVGGERDDFLRVQAAQGAGLPRLTPHPQQSSGALSSLAWAHGLARIPAGARLESGAEVDWMALSDWLS
ncbi:gephyrin-like molybdotransferase Glp [Castellaniella sp.]|jgi:molybdopterin molybdotransferase|uniref:molybdopterin molybdotransferase MoeA n=1 Tax=Castellaniella sp. TaxID=1955812 RepID=UPI002D7EC4DD|nr:gephyrin-like molybdotransferase Glp [Castellaniella sp.]HET8704549.1 gephyrin-like molybdotransferase Glp [Castellaniella sp.]